MLIASIFVILFLCSRMLDMHLEIRLKKREIECLSKQITEQQEISEGYKEVSKKWALTACETKECFDKLNTMVCATLEALVEKKALENAKAVAEVTTEES